MHTYARKEQSAKPLNTDAHMVSRFHGFRKPGHEIKFLISDYISNLSRIKYSSNGSLIQNDFRTKIS